MMRKHLFMHRKVQIMTHSVNSFAKEILLSFAATKENRQARNAPGGIAFVGELQLFDADDAGEHTDLIDDLQMVLPLFQL